MQLRTPAAQCPPPQTLHATAGQLEAQRKRADAILSRMQGGRGRGEAGGGSCAGRGGGRWRGRDAPAAAAAAFSAALPPRGAGGFGRGRGGQGGRGGGRAAAAAFSSSDTSCYPAAAPAYGGGWGRSRRGQHAAAAAAGAEAFAFKSLSFEETLAYAAPAQPHAPAGGRGSGNNYADTSFGGGAPYGPTFGAPDAEFGLGGNNASFSAYPPGGRLITVSCSPHAARPRCAPPAVHTALGTFTPWHLGTFPRRDEQKWPPHTLARFAQLLPAGVSAATATAAGWQQHTTAPSHSEALHSLPSPAAGTRLEALGALAAVAQSQPPRRGARQRCLTRSWRGSCRRSSMPRHESW